MTNPLTFEDLEGIQVTLTPDIHATKDRDVWINKKDRRLYRARLSGIFKELETEKSKPLTKDNG